MTRKPKRQALWVTCYPDQAKRLRPEAYSKAGGVRVRSQTEQIRMSVYRAIKKLYLARHPNCECCADADVSPHPAEDVHHLRGTVGWLLVDVRYYLPTCRAQHIWLHQNPDEARKLKLLASKGRWNTI